MNSRNVPKVHRPCINAPPPPPNMASKYMKVYNSWSKFFFFNFRVLIGNLWQSFLHGPNPAGLTPQIISTKKKEKEIEERKRNRKKVVKEKKWKRKEKSPNLRYSKFYPIKIIQKKLSTNKWRKKYYPEVLSKKCFIQNVRDLFYVTLYF